MLLRKCLFFFRSYIWGPGEGGWSVWRRQWIITLNDICNSEKKRANCLYMLLQKWCTVENVWIWRGGLWVVFGLVRFLLLPPRRPVPTKGPPRQLSHGPWPTGHGPWLSWLGLGPSLTRDGSSKAAGNYRGTESQSIKKARQIQIFPCLWWWESLSVIHIVVVMPCVFNLESHVFNTATFTT